MKGEHAPEWMVITGPGYKASSSDHANRANRKTLPPGVYEARLKQNEEAWNLWREGKTYAEIGCIQDRSGNSVGAAIRVRREKLGGYSE